MLGADELLRRHPAHAEAYAMIERGGAFLHALWKSSRRPDWDWFEAGLAYDNARLAEALIRAGRRLRALPYAEAGLSPLARLSDRKTGAGGELPPPGSYGLCLVSDTLSFSQHPP